jgi:heme/copper-type cytochrome/quinol oxidase subunit 2
MGKKIIIAVIVIGALGILSVVILNKSQAPASEKPIVADDIIDNTAEVKNNNMPVVPENDGQPVNDTEVVKEFSMTSFVEFVDEQPKPQFSLKEITVNKGDKVKLKITNTKGVHDFKLDEFDVFANTPLGEEVVVEFTADKAGEFVYYCNQPGHRQAGQWGTLKVLE